MHSGWTVIIVVLQIGAVRIYVTVVEALRKTKNRMKLSLTQNLMVFEVSHHPSPRPPRPLNGSVLFAGVFKTHPVYDQTQGSSAVFFSLY